MARSFSDGLAKGLGIGSAIVGIYMMTMASILPFGFLSFVLNVKDFFWVKFAVGSLFSLVTLLYYFQFARKLKVSPISWLFGAIIAAVWPFDAFFILTDLILKLAGLE